MAIDMNQSQVEADDTVIECACVRVTCAGCLGLVCCTVILGLIILGVTLFTLPYISS